MNRDPATDQSLAIADYLRELATMVLERNPKACALRPPLRFQAGRKFSLCRILVFKSLAQSNLAESNSFKSNG
jgi:hypothetical protein